MSREPSLEHFLDVPLVETAQERPEERYHRLLDTAPDAMVVVGEGGRIDFVNAQTEKMFGYARAEILGQSLEMLIPERFRAGHGARVASFFGSPTLRPMGSGLDLFGRRKDGTELPIEVSLSPVRAGGRMSVSAAIRDVTERKRIEAAAKLAASRLTSAVESIQDAFALFDARDQLVQCNSVYRLLVGEAIPGTLIGKTFEEILDAWTRTLTFEDDDARARFRVERLVERRDPRGAFEIRTSDGRSLRVANRRTAEGGIVQTIWDLTDDARREEELREARRAAEAGSTAKSEFLSSMSHELRTPLNAILGFAQLLRRDKKDPLSDRHKVRVDQILKGGEHLLRLIDDVLDLSRIEANGISISTEPVGVLDAIEEVKTTLESMAARTGIHLDLAALPPGVPMIVADRTRFVQILMNFGSNAIKYNRPGGTVTLTVSTPSPERVRVTVADTGMGIAPDKQNKLFQPFQRAGQEAGPIEGTGIGLAITKRLAEMMQGTFGFQSALGQGSEFWVEMPSHDAGPRAIREDEVVEAREPRLELKSRKVILYVEDNPANVVFMVDLLSSFENIDLLTAPTAEMGVELARARQPRVIIMDINLPGMSGVDALHMLREWPETKHIPVIALTAAASQRDRQRGEQAGFYRYLAKPVKVDELEGALQSLLGHED